MKIYYFSDVIMICTYFTVYICCTTVQSSVQPKRFEQIFLTKLAYETATICQPLVKNLCGNC